MEKKNVEVISRDGPAKSPDPMHTPNFPVNFKNKFYPGNKFSNSIIETKKSCEFNKAERK